MRTLFIFILTLLAGATARADSELTVDLHSHPFMNEGMTWMFLGDFDAPLKASSWTDKLSSMANPETLNQSGIGILVVSLYANNATTFDMRDAIRAQMGLAERFVARHPNWMIARGPGEARAALRNGRRVLIFALEGTSGILDREEDLVEFVDKRGLSIVTLMHLSDDRYGGVAMMSGVQSLASPLTVLDQLFDPVYDHEGVRVNRRGMTKLGADFARKLTARKVWIDLAHASDKTLKTLIPIVKEAGQPLLYTHTTLRRFRKAERAISDAQLQDVRKTGGIVGICPSHSVLVTDRADARLCGLGPLALHYAEAVKILGADAVMMGTDFNGGMDHLPPACGTGTSLDKGGLWHIGQVGELWQALRKSGAPVPASLNSTIDRFLDTWEKVRK